MRITLITQINNFRIRIAISELLFNRNGQKIFRIFSLIIYYKIIIPD